MIIPLQLQNPDFRFYLIGSNSKLPMEKKWNSDNNYSFFHEKIVNHKGNYGICTGYGQVIVLDMDSRDYYKSIADKLPATFTVLSAGKRLPHLYYILKGEMFKKIGIDNYFNTKYNELITDKKRINNLDEVAEVMSSKKFTKWLNERNITLIRVCDIQADKAGIVAPGSIINRKYYNISNDRDLAVITLEELQEAFNIKSRNVKIKYKKGCVKHYETCPKKVQHTVSILNKLNIKRTNLTMFKCPFHEMTGAGNLSVMDNGRLWCFHCQTLWRSPEEFEKEYKEFKK